MRSAASLVLVNMTSLLVLAASSSCAPSTPAAQPTTVSSATPAASPTRRPTPTATGTATAVPGFEGWQVINPQDVDIRTENGALIMTLTHRALWFMQQRGVLLYKPVSGDFRITADIHTAKSSDTSQPPGGKGSVQLGGVMARSDAGAQENYVFIVVGDDGDGLSVETKNTVNGLSKFDGPAWGSADAQLRLCRSGITLTAYTRHASTDEPWQQAASFDRPDLPADLQVGLNIYTDAAPDLQVRYESIKIEMISSAQDCTG